jgi:hypothetical protein
VRGEGIGNRVVRDFDPVSAQRWRLVILETDSATAPQINEFQLFAP